MKRLFLFSIVLLSFLLPVSAQGSDSWTVMLYICGSNLESDYGMATLNITEIAQTHPVEGVNVLLETGGAKSWGVGKYQNLDPVPGLEISATAIERRSFDKNGFTLLQTLPDAPMNDPEQLSDFIQWASENYPAEKYALLLWDHGGGPAVGILRDNLHPDHEMISISELGNVLEKSGLHFEMIMFDACLMASLETAQMIAPYANYLAASEEYVSDLGSYFSEWLDYLYRHPYTDGKHFGRAYCDTMVTKYADSLDIRLSTSSLIDLSRVDAVADAFAAVLREVSEKLDTPGDFMDFSWFIRKADRFGGTNDSTLYDLADFSRKARNSGISDEALSALDDAVDDAVLYQVKGSFHSHAGGLSFYYDLSKQAKSEYYAKQCKIPELLALMDAVNPNWEAPEWVYEQTARLDEVDPADFEVLADTFINEDGKLALNISGAPNAVKQVDYQLYSYFEGENNEPNLLYMGSSHDVDGDFRSGRFVENFDGYWPSIEGSPVWLEVYTESEEVILYNIGMVFEDDGKNIEPVMELNDEQYAYLRAGYIHVDADPNDPDDFEDDVYVIYGVWDGYDTNTDMPGRNSKPLYEVEGKKIRLIRPYMYPDKPDIMQDYFYVDDNPVTLSNKNTFIVETLIPDGDYAIRYKITDVFGNFIYTDMIYFSSVDGVRTYREAPAK